MSFTVIIPARYSSTRFPGKPLALIKNKPMIQHVYERAIESGASKVIVATDDQRIADVCTKFDASICMTNPEHESGTERIAQVVEDMCIESNEIVVNVQGDEPFIPVENINQVASNLSNSQMQMSTLCFPIEEFRDASNPNIVKVVKAKTGKALYFSRAMIPFDRASMGSAMAAQQVYYRHIGIYAYRAGFITEYLSLSSSDYEVIESLEQLRVLYHGYDIHVEVAKCAPPHGVDTPEDLAKLEQLNL